MSSKTKFKLIIGLGNPDEQYQNTFHNAGYLTTDYFIKKLNGKAAKPEDWETGPKNFIFLKTSGIIFVKPTVYMNESGKAVSEAAKYFSGFLKKVRPEQILVIHDDIDIELGNFKLSFNKNSAGHKGVESIIKALKTKEFWRLRIGIGRPNADKRGLKRGTTRKKVKAMEVVLSKIGKIDSEKINQAIKDSFKQLEIAD